MRFKGVACRHRADAAGLAQDDKGYVSAAACKLFGNGIDSPILEAAEGRDSGLGI